MNNRNMTVIDEILKCETTDEVNNIIDDINSALRTVKNKINGRARFDFSVGDKVLVNERKVRMNGITYHVPFNIMQLKEAI